MGKRYSSREPHPKKEIPSKTAGNILKTAGLK